MTPFEIIEILRQAYVELEFEASPTADQLGEVIFQLAAEWSVPLVPYGGTANRRGR